MWKQFKASKEKSEYKPISEYFVYRTYSCNLYSWKEKTANLYYVFHPGNCDLFEEDARKRSAVHTWLDTGQKNHAIPTFIKETVAWDFRALVSSSIYIPWRTLISIMTDL